MSTVNSSDTTILDQKGRPICETSDGTIATFTANSGSINCHTSTDGGSSWTNIGQAATYTTGITPVHITAIALNTNYTGEVLCVYRSTTTEIRSAALTVSSGLTIHHDNIVVSGTDLNSRESGGMAAFSSEFGGTFQNSEKIMGTAYKNLHEFTYAEGQSWNNRTNLNAQSATSSKVSVSAANDGYIHAAWDSGGSSLEYGSIVGASTGRGETVASHAFDGAMVVPSGTSAPLITSSDGSGNVVLYDRSGGSWSTAETVYNGGDAADPTIAPIGNGEYAIVFDVNGDLYINTGSPGAFDPANATGYLTGSDTYSNPSARYQYDYNQSPGRLDVLYINNTTGELAFQSGTSVSSGSVLEASGSLTGVGTSTGAATRNIRLTGSTSAVGSTSASATRNIGFSGSNTATATATGSATRNIGLTGSGVGAGGLGGTAIRVRGLSGNLTGVGTLASAPTRGRNASVSAVATGSATGAATRNIGLTASGNGTGTVTGSATRNVGLAGNLQSNGSLSGQVIRAVGLTGETAGIGTLSGNPSLATTQVIDLSGNLVAGGALNGLVTRTVSITATANASGKSSASLSRIFTVNGMLTGGGSISATPVCVRNLGGDMTGIGSMTGSTALTANLSGSLSASGDATGTFLDVDKLVHQYFLTAVYDPDVALDSKFSPVETSTAGFVTGETLQGEYDVTEALTGEYDVNEEMLAEHETVRNLTAAHDIAIKLKATLKKHNDT